LPGMETRGCPWAPSKDPQVFQVLLITKSYSFIVQ
jgi:hypothetical protein